MGRGYRTCRGRDGIQFLIVADMCRIKNKYIGVKHGNREGKTLPHPTPLPCLIEHTLVTKKNKKSKTYLFM